jgi:hypothetical protein
MSPLALSVIAFACIFAGTLLGMFLRRRLPGEHLSAEAKDVVRSGTSLVATIAGLVLGLLIASANGTHQTQSEQVKQLAANAALLDATLAQYGPDADQVRDLLRRGLAVMTDRIWKENRSDFGRAEAFEMSTTASALYHAMLKLAPQNDAQRSLQARAIDTLNETGKTRLLLYTKAGRSLPMPFLVVLISWLTIIFASFSLFADNNATTIAASGIFALSASAAIFLILELSEPFAGLMMISDGPLRNALAPLGSS